MILYNIKISYCEKKFNIIHIFKFGFVGGVTIIIKKLCYLHHLRDIE